MSRGSRAAIPRRHRRPSRSARRRARRGARTHGIPFTHVGLNFYRDGNDSVAPHNDKLATLIPGHPIVLLSLGDPRRMEIRAKQPPRNVVRIDLEAGSLLSMSHAMQSAYDHGIPKIKHAVGPRISLAFRVRPPKDNA
jgi:alkylated DNA repair dioxygenase AlkB